MTILLLIASLLGYNPSYCNVGDMTALYEDMSYTTDWNRDFITCPNSDSNETTTKIIILESTGGMYYSAITFEFHPHTGESFPESVIESYFTGKAFVTPNIAQ